MSISEFQYKFQINPITLVGGINSGPPGSAQSILAYTEAGSFGGSLSQEFGDTSQDDFFAQFMPLPGATLIDQEIGMYPFANQTVAANAVITQPRRVSMLMICPARGPGGIARKQSILSALVATLQDHNNKGGTYTVATPNYTYDNCLLINMRDVSTSETKQPQVSWQLDFVQPLLTIQQAQKSEGNLMSRLTRQTRLNSDAGWTSPEMGVGQPASLMGTSIFPSSKSSSSAGSMPAGPANTPAVGQ